MWHIFELSTFFGMVVIKGIWIFSKLPFQFIQLSLCHAKKVIWLNHLKLIFLSINTFICIFFFWITYNFEPDIIFLHVEY